MRNIFAEVVFSKVDTDNNFFRNPFSKVDTMIQGLVMSLFARDKYWRRDDSQWFADFRRHRCFVARLGTPQKSGCHWRVAGFLEVKLPLKVHCFFISMVNTPSEGGFPDDFRRGNWRYAALLVGLYKKNPRHKTNDIQMFLKIDIAFRAILV